MAKRHWLDPLARRLLIVSGQIRPTTAPADPPASQQDSVERDLLALRLAQNPALPLRDATEVRHAAALGWSLDVNRASAADWRRLPGCGPAQVDLLLRLQRGGVQLSGPEDLRAVLDLEGGILESWLPLLRFRWYGEPPPSAGPLQVAINQASASLLATLPELTAERSMRLLRERARGPFRDLADLRDRLALPPTVVEQWIGRVSFEPGRPGPELPLGPPAPADRSGGPAATGSTAPPKAAGPSLPPARPDAGARRR